MACALNIFTFLGVLLFSILNIARSQLSEIDKNQIKSLINTSRDEKSGLFGPNLETTYKAVFSLHTLGEEIKDIPKICKEIGYVSNRSSSVSIVLLDHLLSCKNEIVDTTDQSETLNSLSGFYENLQLGIRSNFKFQPELTLLRLQAFQNKDKLFNPTNTDSPLINQVSLIHTTYGLRSMALLYSHLDEKLKIQVTEDIKLILTFIDTNYYQVLNEVIIC